MYSWSCRHPSVVSTSCFGIRMADAVEDIVATGRAHVIVPLLLFPRCSTDGRYRVTVHSMNFNSSLYIPRSQGDTTAHAAYTIYNTTEALQWLTIDTAIPSFGWISKRPVSTLPRTRFWRLRYVICPFILAERGEH